MKRIICLFVLFACCIALYPKGNLFVLVGAASKPAAEELISAFEKKTGISVTASYGGSGVLLTQLQLTHKGDLYFPGSIDFIEKAKKLNLIDVKSITPIVYLVPCINVWKGNPKNIHSIKDLCNPGIKVVIANPECVCLGVFATELVEKLLNKKQKEAFRNNVINYTNSCSKTAFAISMKSADAVIGWNVFRYWDPKRIESVKLPKDEVIRVSYLSIAITKQSKNKKLAKNFIEFMLSNEGMKYFKKYNYFTNPSDAVKFVGEKKPIGGKPFKVPQYWYK